MGLAMLWLSVIVLLPLAALAAKSLDGGLSAFWDSVSSRQAVSTLKFTLIVSVIVAAINAVAGLAIAWTLVRDEFPGRRIVNAIIDLPFAMPTIVVGITLLALWGPTSPVGVNLAFTAAVGRARAAVRHAAVRRARRAAGADRARPGDGAGRRVARRAPADDLPPDHPAQPDARDPVGRRAVVRARRRASSARSS